MAIDRSKFLIRFTEEAREQIKKMNDGLLTWEKFPGDSEALNSVFRAAHTIKGASKMLKLTAINEVAHKLEDALDALREGRIRHSKGLSDLFFKAADIIEELVGEAASGGETTADIGPICGELEDAARGKSREEETLWVKSAEPADEEMTPEKESAFIEATPSPKTKKTAPENAEIKMDETIRISAVKLDEAINLMEEIISLQSRSKQRLYEIKEAALLSKNHEESLKIMEANGFSRPSGDKEELLQTAESVHLKLNDLFSGFRDDVNMQKLLTGELQEKALRLRMLPLSTIFDDFPRSVRDISASSGKKIELIIEGGATELDKKLIEKIGDPLVHMLRNSIDHGIERPDDRLRAGKPETGTIKLSACYEGGSVLIELSDDGGGISLGKIKEKAIQRKIFDEETLEKMPGSEVIDLIFRPGFSTAAIITDISGRGVGMDVVKRNIVDQMKGSVQVETEKGKGTSFSIRLPVSLAIMRVLQISIGDMAFALPVSSTAEILKVPQAKIIDVVDKKAIRLREQIIPVADLRSLLNIHGDNGNARKEALVVITFMGNEKLGLMVDSILEEEDMIIKPLPMHMKGVQLVSGVTISGKNEIISVLHVPMIFNLSKEIKDAKRFDKKVREERKTINILLVEDSITTREIEKRILESYGYRVEAASNGMEALEKAREFKYDLIVTDIEMPLLDGFSLTEKLRKDGEYKNTPVIIVTSLDREEDKRRGIQVGADAYIIKGSFDQTNLLDTVQNLVG